MSPCCQFGYFSHYFPLLITPHKYVSLTVFNIIKLIYTRVKNHFLHYHIGVTKPLKRLIPLVKYYIVFNSGCHYLPAREIANKISTFIVMTLTSITKAKFYISTCVQIVLSHRGEKKKKKCFIPLGIFQTHS